MDSDRHQDPVRKIKNSGRVHRFLIGFECTPHEQNGRGDELNQDETKKLIDAIIRDLNRKKKKGPDQRANKPTQERTAMKTIQRDFNTAVDDLFDCTITEPMEIIGKAFFGGLVGMTLAVILYVAVTLI